MEIWSLVPWLHVDRKQMHYPLDHDAPWLSIDICFRFAKFEKITNIFATQIVDQERIGWQEIPWFKKFLVEFSTKQ